MRLSLFYAYSNDYPKGVHVFMKGWIIYNGNLRIEKNKLLVESLAHKACAMGMHLEVLTNDLFINTLSSDETTAVHYAQEVCKPDFVIFWDKDIRLAEQIEAMGIRCFNPSRGIEVCDNKIQTFQHLVKKGIAMPKTIVAPFTFSQVSLKKDYIQAIESLGYPMIIKEAYGSFGMQVHLVNHREALLECVEKMGNKPFLFQSFISSSFGRDVRLTIVDGEVVGAMKRVSTSDFRANITLGGEGSPYTPTLQETELALKAHHALNLDFSGVDLIHEADGTPLICEVNSNPNYLSSDTNTGSDVGQAILNCVRRQIYG